SGALNGAISSALKASGFREKPNQETAREFLSRGGFYWNAGMFIFRVSKMTELFSKYAPDIWNLISKLNSDLSNIDEIYKSVKSTSIDYAIMERLPSHVCIPCTFGWNDLGSWDSISALPEFHKGSNQPIEIESSGNFVFPHGKKAYGFVGVEDLVVIDTADALLVARKGETELVKQLVDQLKTSGKQV
ncbi:MAG: mannose-1-phosphate guanylyltransferase/mannose-6-phosphate isomerase, partial [Proteobacteria bacterium]